MVTAWVNLTCTYRQNTVVWEKFVAGIFQVKKFHVKMFSFSWINYSHIFPYLFNSKIFHVLNFHPSRLQTKKFNSEPFPNYDSSFDIFICTCLCGKSCCITIRAFILIFLQHLN